MGGLPNLVDLHRQWEIPLVLSSWYAKIRRRRQWARVSGATTIMVVATHHDILTSGPRYLADSTKMWGCEAPVGPVIQGSAGTVAREMVAIK